MCSLEAKGCWFLIVYAVAGVCMCVPERQRDRKAVGGGGESKRESFCISSVKIPACVKMASIEVVSIKTQ